MGRRWVVYGNYTGPGNRLDRHYLRTHPPVDALDRASLRHDLAYKRLGSRAYWRGSAADVQYLKDVWAAKPSSLKGKLVKAGALGFFGVKNAISAAAGLSLSRKDEMFRLGRSRSRSRGSRRRSVARSRSSSRARSRSTAVAGVVAGLHRGTGERGSYVGRFRKPKRAKRVGKFARYGFTGMREASGQQSATDVMYLGVSSARQRDIGIAVGAALWRKILRKHLHMEIANPHEVLNGWAHDTRPDPLPIKCRWYCRQFTAGGYDLANGTVLDQEITTTPVSLMDLALWWSVNVFENGVFGGKGNTSGNAWELYGYQLVFYDSLDLITRTDAPQHVIPIYDDVITCYELVKMTVQNVTTADGITGDNLDADRIDKNPVMGKLWKLGSICPRLRDNMGAYNTSLEPIADKGWKLEFDVNDDGLILPHQSLTGYFGQVPEDHMFRFVKGVANVSLEPGHMRDFTIKFKYRGKINNLIKGFGHNPYTSNTTTGATVPGDVGDGYGQCMLLALEKRMSTGSNSVTVNYQYESYFGAHVGGHRPTLMRSYRIPGNAASTYLNITAGEPAKDAAGA